MHKVNRLFLLALATALLASFTIGQVGLASAQTEPPVGVVVEYNAGQNITIVDQTGTQHQYVISSTMKILPPGGARSLAVGSFVTIIAPASLNQGKQVAVGIVVHPHIPNGWNVPSLSATPLTTGTAVETYTATPSGTALATETATGTPLATDTATPTATGTQLAGDTQTPTATETPTATPPGGGSNASTDALIQWLRSLFQQILSSR